ncbi:hypothetical protein [Orenia marismortui]|uniref:hypothetical protein n=1 Tax=Orenia marismortui TaxID=46469 RepID=UPI00036085B0|nr:hypothetical protein [Orenia marismortui]
MAYKVLHRFELEDGTESEALEKDEFIDKFKEKLLDWEKGYQFVEMVAESALEEGAGRVA